eukprot:TRINITY_DN2899_c0_g1_i2.p2 TRINITY_DN2899_c0_g1~~TRINITY_DN2899_c0_g1_i2.p2  ORF type:complete len:149 (+),score=29.65 TRINITY_DN2899_c0_g1_i2:354-800(+)
MFADSSKYNGYFKQNEIEGQGVYKWPDGKCYSGLKVLPFLVQFYCLGSWVNNQMSGKGTLKWLDGRKYVGEYYQDKKMGFGIFSWPDGRKYIGYWENGKQNGFGKYASINGEVKIGEWVAGKRINWLTEEEVLEKSIQFPEEQNFISE